VLDDDEVQRALVISAHPDDVDFGAAGTVATWSDAGIEVAYCIVTDGDAGGFDPSVPRAEIPGIRRAEQTAAAKEVGVTDLAFLGYPDGRLVKVIFDAGPGGANGPSWQDAGDYVDRSLYVQAMDPNLP